MRIIQNCPIVQITHPKIGPSWTIPFIQKKPFMYCPNPGIVRSPVRTGAVLSPPPPPSPPVLRCTCPSPPPPRSPFTEASFACYRGLLFTTEDNAHYWEQSSNQPDWLEQM